MVLNRKEYFIKPLPPVKKKLSTLKPGVSRRVHLFLAPFLWTCIGCLLMYRGFGWIGKSSSYWLGIVAFLLGSAKSLLILDRTARRGVRRIMQLNDGTCLGAVYSWKTWFLVALMMVSGIALRKITEPGRIVGTIYMAVGWALIFSSRHGWRQWFSGDRVD